MARLRFRGRSQQRNGMLVLVALGAVAGLALGVLLAEKSGGLDGLKTRVRNAKRRRRVDEHDHADDDHLAPGVAPRYAADAADGEHADEDVLREAHRPSEAELEARVLEVFRNDPTLRGRAIDIGAIGDGTIELTGWVHSPAELTHALTLAGGVPDVEEVMDSLTVRGTDQRRAGQSRTDH